MEELEIPKGGGVLYCVENLVDGTRYFGITSRPLKRRIKQHYVDAYTMNSAYYFHRALRVFGWESFVWTVVAVFSTRDDLILGEIAAIREAGLKGERLYNLTEGGEGRRGRGRALSVDHRNKISAALRGKKRAPLSEDHKKALSEAHRGKRLTEEHKFKLSKVRPNLTQEQREKKRRVWAETSRSEKERERRRALKKAYWEGVSKENRVAQAKKASEAAREKCVSLSEEERVALKNKLSLAVKMRWSVMTEDQRRAVGQKTWATRRANKAKKQVLVGCQLD